MGTVSMSAVQAMKEHTADTLGGKEDKPMKRQGIRKLFRATIAGALLIVTLFLSGCIKLEIQERKYRKNYSKNEPIILQYLSSYEKNENLILIGNGYIYTADAQLAIADLPLESEKSIVYATADTVYHYRYDQSTETLTLYRSDYAFRNTEQLLSHVGIKKTTPRMFDARYLYLYAEAGELYRYDLETGERTYDPVAVAGLSAYSVYHRELGYDYFDEYLYSTGKGYSTEKGDLPDVRHLKRVTVTRLSDGLTKSFTTDDISRVYEAGRVETLANSYRNHIYKLCFTSDGIFVVCFLEKIVTVYSYDFETEKILFWGWHYGVEYDDFPMICIRGG